MTTTPTTKPIPVPAGRIVRAVVEYTVSTDGEHCGECGWLNPWGTAECCQYIGNDEQRPVLERERDEDGPLRCDACVKARAAYDELVRRGADCDNCARSDEATDYQQGYCASCHSDEKPPTNWTPSEVPA